MSVTRVQQNEAIRELRRRTSSLTQRGVARAIVNGGHPMFVRSGYMIVDNGLTKRTFHSVYNVIRRHDALERQKRIALDGQHEPGLVLSEVGSEPGNLDLGSNA